MSDIELIRNEVRAALGNAPVARRWQWGARALAATEVAVVVVCVGVALAIQRPLPPLRWLSAVLFVLVVASGTVIAVKPPAAGSRGLFAGLALLSVVVSAVSRGPLDLALHGPECVPLELLLALLPACLTLLILRRFAYRAEEAFIGGLAAGATGLLGLELTCPVETTAHLVAYHFLPCIGVGLALTWTRSRLSSKTYAP
jgi:hypothetical protein